MRGVVKQKIVLLCVATFLTYSSIRAMHPFPSMHGCVGNWKELAHNLQQWLSPQTAHPSTSSMEVSPPQVSSKDYVAIDMTPGYPVTPGGEWKQITWQCDDGEEVVFAFDPAVIAAIRQAIGEICGMDQNQAVYSVRTSAQQFESHWENVGELIDALKGYRTSTGDANRAYHKKMLAMVRKLCLNSQFCTIALRAFDIYQQNNWPGELPVAGSSLLYNIVEEGEFEARRYKIRFGVTLATLLTSWVVGIFLVCYFW